MEISVIIPTYNCAKYVSDAINSVLNQTYKECEVIVVDDGSTDDTRAVLAPYIEKGLIRYVYQDNKGVSAARNKGMKLAHGEYIAFLDADDLWDKEFIEIILADGMFDVAICDNWRVEINYSGMVTDRKLVKRDVSLDKNLLVQFLKEDKIGSPSRALIRRSFLIDNRIYFDERLRSREDWDFWLQVFNKNPVTKYVNKPLAIYRIFVDEMENSSRRLGWKWLDYTYLVLTKWKRVYLEEKCGEIYCLHLWNLCGHYMATGNFLKAIMCICGIVSVSPIFLFLKVCFFLKRRLGRK